MPKVSRLRPGIPASCTGNKDRVPHISLVFREMWDTTIPDVQLCRLSLGAKPRDLQFYPQRVLPTQLVGMNCYLARTTRPQGPLPAFIFLVTVFVARSTTETSFDGPLAE